MQEERKPVNDKLQLPHPVVPLPKNCRKWKTAECTFQARSKTLRMASKGQGPFSFWVMMGVFSSFHWIHLM